TIVIVATGTGSPAERAGARPGDLLLGIDSTGVDASRLESARRLLDGPAGTTVVLRIRRQGVRSVVTLDVTRGAFAPAPAVSEALLSGGVGSVRVRRFSAGVTDSVRRAVERLDAAGAGALVLDLRGAVGGTLQDGVAIADLFLGPGLTLATSRGRPGSPSMTYADSTASPFGSMPMAVLVNRGTAGAAEAAAGALQDHDRAIVLGDTTFGRGVTRSTFALGEGASLRLTTALWITPSGRQIQRPARAAADSAPRPGVRSDAGRPLLGGGGIVPDREVPDTGDADLPLDAARKLLLKAGSMRAVLGLAGAR
ncbi:MAG TPA: S41 family peptidase, partial [Gemmatimonadales bacterium]